jgi:coenzyme PQQ precursor peptide PqqA
MVPFLWGPARQTRGNQVPNGTDPRRQCMKWHTPKIVEIACGGEINAYFPAEL